MVDDPRISIAQAAVVLGKKPAQVHRFVALGRVPRHGPANNGRPLLLSEVEALRDKGEPIPLRNTPPTGWADRSRPPSSSSPTATCDSSLARS